MIKFIPCFFYCCCCDFLFDVSVADAYFLLICAVKLLRAILQQKFDERDSLIKDTLFNIISHIVQLTIDFFIFYFQQSYKHNI